MEITSFAMKITGYTSEIISIFEITGQCTKQISVHTHTHTHKCTDNKELWNHAIREPATGAPWNQPPRNQPPRNQPPRNQRV